MNVTKGSLLAVVLGSFAVIGNVSAALPAEISTAVSTAQTDGIALATSVTVMILLIAGAKWLRRAK